MAYHHLAMAAADMAAIHNFYETILGFELVKVEIGPVPHGGWAKHFFIEWPVTILVLSPFGSYMRYRVVKIWTPPSQGPQASPIRSTTLPLTPRI